MGPGRLLTREEAGDLADETDDVVVRARASAGWARARTHRCGSRAARRDYAGGGVCCWPSRRSGWICPAPTSSTGRSSPPDWRSEWPGRARYGSAGQLSGGTAARPLPPWTPRCRRSSKPSAGRSGLGPVSVVLGPSSPSAHRAGRPQPLTKHGVTRRVDHRRPRTSPRLQPSVERRRRGASDAPGDPSRPDRQPFERHVWPGLYIRLEGNLFVTPAGNAFRRHPSTHSEAAHHTAVRAAALLRKVVCAAAHRSGYRVAVRLCGVSRRQMGCGRPNSRS